MPLLIAMFGNNPMVPLQLSKPSADNARHPDADASHSTKHDWGMFEVLDLSINLYAGEEKEFFMSSVAFFTHINSVKIRWRFFYVSGLWWLQ